MIVKLLRCMLANTTENACKVPMEQRYGSQDLQRKDSGVWIEGFECRSCGSSLGRWSKNTKRGGEDKMCFCCGAGEFELNDMELAGLDFEQAARLAGREWGEAHSIYIRVNNPAERWSCNITSNRAGSRLTERFNKALQILEDDITPKDIAQVIKGMEKLMEDK